MAHVLEQKKPGIPGAIKDLPGPRAWPMVGNARQIDRPRMHEQLEAWAKEFGEAYTFSIFSRRFLVLSNPEAVASVLRDRPDGFRRTSRLESVSSGMGFLGLFSANGETWKRQRPMVLSGLDPSHIRAFFPTLIQVTERLAQRWAKAADQRMPIDLQGDLMRYTVDVTVALAFGEDINTLESKEEQLIQTHLNQVLPALFKRLFAPFEHWKYIKLREDRELDKHLRALHLAVDGFMAKTRNKLHEQPGLRERPVNLIQAMMAARDREGSGITDQDVSGNVLTMLLAGEDTTAHTLAWLIWLLHKNPLARQQAAREVDTVLAGGSCPTGVEQTSRLEMVEACANEAMRLKPVAPFIINQALRDCTVAGVRLSAGSLVVCLMRPGGLDALNFPNPQDFHPARWLGGTDAAAHSLSSAKRVVMPFGAGQRICPGRYLALTEIKMAAAMLLSNFEIESVATPDGADPQEQISLTMSPTPLLMHLRRRIPASRNH